MKARTAEEMLRIWFQAEERAAPEEHSAKTKWCPSYREFYDHVTGKAKLSGIQLRHRNQCHYCQLTLKLFTKERLSPTAVGTLQNRLRLVGKGIDQSGRRTVPTVMEDAPEAKVVIEHGPFLSEGGRLVMRISVEGVSLSPERLPLQMDMIFLQKEGEEEGRVLQTFELPELTAQLLATKLPDDVLKDESWANLKERIPIGFILHW
jgi:hypothetical protein